MGSMPRSSRRVPLLATVTSRSRAGPALRQFLAAGKLDELFLHVVPVILGAGERLLEDVGDPVLEPVEVVASPAVTHVRYRIAR